MEKLVWGLPLIIQGLQLEPKGQAVSLKFFRHVHMFLQLAEGQGFSDQDSKASSGEKKQITLHSQIHSS